MNLKETILQFRNLLVKKSTINKSDFLFEFQELENIVIGNGIYINGPLFFSFTPTTNEELGEFEFFAPLNVEAELNTNNNNKFSFSKELIIEKAIRRKIVASDDDIFNSIGLLREEALKKDYKLSNKTYCVLIDVYGEIYCDIYIPILN